MSGTETGPGNDVTRRPTTVASAVAAVGAIVALVAAGYASINGLAIGLLGAVGLAVGLTRGSRSAVDVGCAGLFLGVIVGGLSGAAVSATLLGTVAAVVAWDLAGSALDLGKQLGREADTTRLEAAHAASSVLVGLTTAVVGYGVYAFAAGGQPITAVVLLLVAAALVTVGLGTRRHRRTDRRARTPNRRRP